MITILVLIVLYYGCDDIAQDIADIFYPVHRD